MKITAKLYTKKICCKEIFFKIIKNLDSQNNFFFSIHFYGKKLWFFNSQRI